GVMNGVSDTEFAPAQGITRQEFLTVLYRMAGSVSGTEVMFTALYDEQFADSGEIAVWAKPAMYWGVYKELIRGVAADTLAPLGAVTRAEAAAILVRYSEKLN
ncbi:MAG: S-layer homology domain-containing protein, partial [Oscillospiraceae bacterium]|nr:S-layer homology domain-containing protein [Oscillospiraceae bacterium]